MIEKKRRSKIIWSFEAKLLNEDLAKAVVQEDFDALRIVYDSGFSDRILSFLKALDRFKSTRKDIPIMLDISSRVRGFVQKSFKSKEFKSGDRVRLGTTQSKSDIPIECATWKDLFLKDEQIFLGHGHLLLVARELGSDYIDAEVIQGGAVHSGMDVHVPATRATPKVDQIDLNDLKRVLEYGVDFVGVPGFVEASELDKLTQVINTASKSKPWIILKINSDKVYQNLSELMAHVHGVLISRIELALFMEPALIPVITKEIIQRCTNQAKIVMTASEMLGSMSVNATPTRAEVSDVANAVSDGSDAVVLTEDVAEGPHSVRAIRLMARIVDDIEQKSETTPNWLRYEPIIHEEMDAVASSAYRTANRVGAKAIVCLTKEGNTAVKLSSFRTRKPIVAVSFSPDVIRQLSLVHGVQGIYLDSDPVIDQVLPVVNDLLKKASWLRAGDRIVFVSVTLSPLSRSESNLFTVQTIN